MPADTWVYFLVLLAASGVGVARYKALEKPFKILAWLVWLTLCHEVAVRGLSASGMESSVLYVIYTPVSFGLYVWIYYLLLNGPGMRRLMTGLFLLVVVNGIGLPLLLGGFRAFPAMPIALDSLVVIICSILYFRQVLAMVSPEPLRNHKAFIFNAAVFIYWSAFFARHGLYNEIARSPDGMLLAETIHAYVSCIYYSVLAVVLYKKSPGADT